MAYIKKEDVTFLLYMERKYKKTREFPFIDDYLLWLYEEESCYNEKIYYYKLSLDFKDYMKFQDENLLDPLTGTVAEEMVKEKQTFNFFVGKKYHKKFFKDEFLRFLYKEVYDFDLYLSYRKLEEELILYIEFQSGKERDSCKDNSWE